MKSSEVNFEVVREAAGCVDGAPARQPAPSRVSFRALESCIRASALLSSIAICRDEWIQLIYINWGLTNSAWLPAPSANHDSVSSYPLEN